MLAGGRGPNGEIELCITTKNLLQNAVRYPGLRCVDGTYKMANNQRPLLFSGTVDCRQSFRPIAAFLCDTESADAVLKFLRTVDEQVRMYYVCHVPALRIRIVI